GGAGAAGSTRGRPRARPGGGRPLLGRTGGGRAPRQSSPRPGAYTRPDAPKPGRKSLSTAASWSPSAAWSSGDASRPEDVARGGEAVSGAELVDRACPGALEREPARACSQRGAARRRAEQRPNRLRRCGRIAGGNEQAGLAVADELDRSAGSGRDHGQARGGGLEDHLPERVRRARKAEEVGARVEARQLVSLLLANEDDVVRLGRLELG